MTCGGGFYAVHDFGWMTCPKNPFDPRNCVSLGYRRWTPNAQGPWATPPGPPYPGYSGPHRGGPVGNPAPGPGTW
jgi:hypothetical protein